MLRYIIQMRMTYIWEPMTSVVIHISIKIYQAEIEKESKQTK